MAGGTKEPDIRHCGKMDLLLGMLLGLYVVYCNPEDYETACLKCEAGGRKRPPVRARHVTFNFFSPSLSYVLAFPSVHLKSIFGLILSIKYLWSCIHMYKHRLMYL